MALMGHGTFNSNKTYFALIPWSTEYKKEFSKITAKSWKNMIIVRDKYFQMSLQKLL